MEALILAGGFGTRLAHVVKDVPKPMADIAGKPFLEYLLEYLLKNDIKRVIFAVSYKREIIMNYFGNKYKDMSISYSIEDTPLGTGGGIKKGLSLCREEEVFVVNGDSMFLVDLQGMMSFHNENRSDVTIATKEMENFDRYGTMVVKNKKIVSFREKVFVEEGLINGGIYLLNKKVLLNFEKKEFSFEKDFLADKSLNINIYSYLSDGYFIDIGIPDDYARANVELNKLRF